MDLVPPSEQWLEALTKDADPALHSLLHIEANGLLRLAEICPFPTPAFHTLRAALQMDLGANPARTWRRLLILVRRCCRPPLPERCFAAELYLLLAAQAGRIWQRILNLGTETWQELHKRCDRLDAGQQLTHGLQHLFASGADDLIQDLNARADVVCYTAQVLGALPPAIAAKQTASWLDHPFQQLLAATPDLSALAQKAPPLLPADVNNPIPRKLRDWLDGKIDLKPGQQVRLKEATAANLRRARLDLLRSMARSG